MRLILVGLAAGQVLATSPPSFGQQVPVNGIYTCTDASGRKLRSDRPIPECLDREQRVLGPSGTVRAKVGPSLTEKEIAEKEVQEKTAAERRAQAAEEKRRQRALVLRYPNQQAHDKERAESLAHIATATQAAAKRIDVLREERRKIDRELEFYQGDVSKAPPALKRQIEYVAQSVEAQQRFIRAQEAESRRVEARFDEELARLKELWQQSQGTAPRAAAKP